MPRNMSTTDRRLRVFVVAPAVLVAAAVGSCPLSTLFHLDTSGRRPLPH